MDEEVNRDENGEADGMNLEEGTGRAAAPPSPLFAVPNLTAHPSTASVSTLYYSMWHLCPLKG